ncbi:MAG: aminotransferase class I/II-fold pyridoxal phosphate-dependent enzyme [Candidatus Scalindua sp.]|nr:aminotransferase class I/II-fold pyridoxal phosphate-dependent enzyme [Candidatus Scalindua sp.]
MISDRMQGFEASGIRKVFDLAQKIKNPVNLSIGQPDFDVPDEIKEEAVRAIKSGFNRYTITQGIPELSEKILKQAKLEKGIIADDIMITSGVAGALTLAFLVLINPGDEVLVPDPYFVSFKHLIKFCGGDIKFIDTYPEFELTPSRILSCISSRTKMLLINSPSNPTGAVCRPEHLVEICEIAKKYNLIIISDEIYSRFVYDTTCQSIGMLHENTLTCQGFSKSYAMTGWRLGSVIGPKKIINEMIKLQQYTYICAPSFAQIAGVKALDVDISKYIDDYKEKRDFVYNGLKKNYRLTKPDGAFYLFPQVPWGTDEEFATRAIEKKLLLIPGSVFSEKKSHFRLSYAASFETLEQGVEILNTLATR